MSTITRELAKLFRKITNSEIDADGNAHVVLSPADSLLINNARIALASLEAEPYGYVHKAAYEKTGSCGLSNDREAYRDSSTHVAVYTAPPAPVSVPDGYRLQPISEYDAMCAAMLQGAEPVSNRDKLPDGWVACSERMPGMGVDVLACTISPIGGFEEIETAQWHGGMKGEQPVFITSADAIEPTHWMPLPAAPKQELK